MYVHRVSFEKRSVSVFFFKKKDLFSFSINILFLPIPKYVLSVCPVMLHSPRLLCCFCSCCTCADARRSRQRSKKMCTGCTLGKKNKKNKTRLCLEVVAISCANDSDKDFTLERPLSAHDAYNLPSAFKKFCPSSIGVHSFCSILYE